MFDKNNYSIVVAEDETLLLDNLISKIDKLNIGFEVVGKAQTGLQALELVNNLNPDVVITDIKMPLMDGLELIEKVRNQYPFTKFIIISGFSEFEYAQKAILFQVSEYLLKPVSEDDLKTALLRIKQSFESDTLRYKEVFNQDIASITAEELAVVIRDFLVSNYNMDINLNMIAKNINYSSSYITKLFQEQYGTTPNKFIISMRMSKAKHYLIHNHELTICQISDMIGYEDQGYFSRIFKKYCGCNPSSYREKNQ